MLPVLLGIGAAISALTANGAATIGAGIGVATVVGANLLAKKRMEESAKQTEMDTKGVDSEVFEMAFKEALEKACKGGKLE
jgi:phosphotransferase system  glucose/maltose/N-acetylglucosamine-specific IIC component